jgi:hypothetical protein
MLAIATSYAHAKVIAHAGGAVSLDERTKGKTAQRLEPVSFIS